MKLTWSHCFVVIFVQITYADGTPDQKTSPRKNEKEVALQHNRMAGRLMGYIPQARLRIPHWPYFFESKNSAKLVLQISPTFQIINYPQKLMSSSILSSEMVLFLS